MNNRYVSLALRPRSIAADDDWWSETRETVNVIIDDDVPQDTGLVDQHGTKIYRTPVRERCGF